MVKILTKRLYHSVMIPKMQTNMQRVKTKIKLLLLVCKVFPDISVKKLGIIRVFLLSAIAQYVARPLWMKATPRSTPMYGTFSRKRFGHVNVYGQSSMLFSRHYIYLRRFPEAVSSQQTENTVSTSCSQSQGAI